MKPCYQSSRSQVGPPHTRVTAILLVVETKREQEWPPRSPQRKGDRVPTHTHQCPLAEVSLHRQAQTTMPWPHNAEQGLLTFLEKWCQPCPEPLLPPPFPHTSPRWPGSSLLSDAVQTLMQGLVAQDNSPGWTRKQQSAAGLVRLHLSSRGCTSHSGKRPHSRQVVSLQGCPSPSPRLPPHLPRSLGTRGSKVRQNRYTAQRPLQSSVVTLTLAAAPGAVRPRGSRNSTGSCQQARRGTSPHFSLYSLLGKH